MRASKSRQCLSVDQVSIFHDGREIACHRRAFANNKWILDPDHYLELLHKRPGAFDTAKPIKQWRPQWPDNHQRLLRRLEKAQGSSKGIKDFIEILMLYRDFDTATVSESVEMALISGGQLR